MGAFINNVCMFLCAIFPNTLAICLFRKFYSQMAVQHSNESHAPIG